MTRHRWEHLEEEVPEIRRRTKARSKKLASDLISGTVTRTRGHHFDVQTTDGPRLCEIRGRLLQEKQADTLVAVGDQVQITPQGKSKGWIEAVAERESVLSRQRPSTNHPVEDVILANPDQALVVFSVTQPDPHLRMLDRFLVVAESNDLETTICVNKVDLTGIERAQELFWLYEKIGYLVIYASAETGLGVDALREFLDSQMTVVAGPSGVGKSSLINAIHPSLNLNVGDLRNFEGKGSHTTRSAHLIPLPFGTDTYIADTPGIRELGLYEIEPVELPFYFREIALFANNCHFPTCTHDHEPECAVRDAVETGQINLERYESYLRLLAGDA